MSIHLDGTGKAEISTGVGFLDHMLELFARHGLFDVAVKVTGDLHVDQHHTTEDTRIALGQAFLQALGDKGIARYADVHLPMDETLSRVALDLSGRAFLVFNADFPSQKIGAFDTRLVQEWFQAFAMNGCDAPRADAVRRQQPSYRREPVQGSGPRLASRRSGGPSRGGPRSLHEGYALTGFQVERAPLQQRQRRMNACTP